MFPCNDLARANSYSLSCVYQELHVAITTNRLPVLLSIISFRSLITDP